MSSLEPANQQVAQHYHCISTMCYPPEYGSSNDQNAKILRNKSGQLSCKEAYPSNKNKTKQKSKKEIKTKTPKNPNTAKGKKKKKNQTK